MQNLPSNCEQAPLTQALILSSSLLQVYFLSLVLISLHKLNYSMSMFQIHYLPTYLDMCECTTTGVCCSYLTACTSWDVVGLACVAPVYARVAAKDKAVGVLAPSESAWSETTGSPA